ncbi:putative glycosyl transferase [Sporomusa ovata DSM 2662]|uniref:Glycosyltransferase n=1 Tax=Sporomusa ovata TaxID=2378 RepID=A0A0U1L6H1_9FIRM|nr:glycosyltransferase family 4 protein [Sporomusa ovata]EQB28549.1 glycosyltransferase [Sporomusa ovata DSM 2662]CQR74879.1 Glycosyltransferase [Sporomusa ovata]
MNVVKDKQDMRIKNVWFFHHYAVLPSMSGQIRPFNFGKLLKKSGFDATVFAASYLHHSDVNLINDGRKYLLNNEYGVPFVFLNTPSSASGLVARIRNMATFYFSLLKHSKRYAKEYGKPDVIIASSPHPLTMIAGIRVARKFKIPCICEVRDLWPEAIFSFGKLKEHSLLGRLLTAGEHWIYRNADALIFTKEGDTDYIKSHKWDTGNGGDIDLTKCHYINNGVNIEAFLKNIADNPIKDIDLLDNKFHVVYIGSIRPVNDVSMLLDAAALLKEHGDIQFLIYGDGNQKEALEQRVLDEGLTNVKMKGYVDRQFIPYILSKSSVNILNYSQFKYNWTRGNSSNKLFEYMASGKPIISTIKMGYCILEKYQCGLSLEASTPEELARTILKVHDMPQEQYEEMGRNAQTGAANFDYKVLTAKLIAVIESASGNSD